MTSLIHVGMSKAASTTLQTSVFPGHPDIYYYGKTESADPIYPTPESRTLTLSMVNLDRFAGFEDDFVGRIRGHVSEAERDGKLFVFSNEHFCESTCPMLQAQVFKEVFQTPKILLVVRNQYDAIASQYKFIGSTLKFAPPKFKGKFVSFDQYYTHAKRTYHSIGGHQSRDWISDYFRMIHYDTFLNITEKVIGIENIIVVPFEKIIKDMSYLIGAIEEKSDFTFKQREIVPPPRMNSSMSKRGVGLLRLVTKIPGNQAARDYAREHFPKLHQMLTRGGSKFVVPDKYHQEIHELYAECNQRVSERYNLDLGSLGYPI